MLQENPFQRAARRQNRSGSVSSSSTQSDSSDSGSSSSSSTDSSTALPSTSQQHTAVTGGGIPSFFLLFNFMFGVLCFLAY